MLFLSLALAALILLASNLIAGRPWGLVAAAILATLMGLLLFIMSCGGLPELFLTGALISVAALISLPFGQRRRLFRAMSVVALVLAYSIEFVLEMTPSPEKRRLQQRYPVESMADRLAYERQRTGDAKGGMDSVKDVAQLKKLEQQIDLAAAGSPGWLRERSLELLHEKSVADFISRPGTGLGRGIQPSLDRIDLPEPEPIALPPALYDPDGPPAGGTALDLLRTPDSKTAPSASVAGEPLGDLHRASVVDFVNPKGFGLFQDREHVRGFQSHQFQAMPMLGGANSQHWRIQSLQLVSLLKHNEPFVYISEHLPRMQELAKVSTRPLDPFEWGALAGLQQGEELAVQTGLDRIRMLGSIRAVKQCLQCHDVPRGFLLGAFSYDLRRAQDGP